MGLGKDCEFASVIEEEPPEMGEVITTPTPVCGPCLRGLEKHF